MDKYEYKVRYDQIKQLYDEENYAQAAKVADTVDWRKVKDWSTLAMVINIYEVTDHLEDAKNVCVLAYNRKLGGKRLIYKLCDLLIKTGDLSEASEVYDEFVAKAPRDLSRYALQYQLYTAKGASTDKLISILKEYNELDRDEYCLNEMALLYEKSGQIEKCMQTCDDIILWFNGGDFYEDALRLKRKYGALTHNQKLMLEHAESLKERPDTAKSRSITLDLPRGILTASDIIKVATGEINTKEINKAANVVTRPKTSEERGVVTKPKTSEEREVVAGPKTSEEREVLDSLKTSEVTEDLEAKEEVREEVKIPDLTINKKERVAEPRGNHKPLKFLNFLSKSSDEDQVAPQIEKTIIPELEEALAKKEETFVKEEASDIEDSVSEKVKSDIESEEVSVTADTEEESPKLTHTQAIRVEKEVLREESRIIGQEPVLDPEYEDAKSNTVKITIPDYANYDTVNIQKEIAENIRPYLDSWDDEEEKIAPAVSEGDIITTEDGVFRVTSNDNRHITDGENYDLTPVTEEELFGNAKEEAYKPSKDESVSELAKEPSDSEPIKEEKEDLTKTVKIETIPKYHKTPMAANLLVAPTINISGILNEVNEILEDEKALKPTGAPEEKIEGKQTESIESKLEDKQVESIESKLEEMISSEDAEDEDVSIDLSRLSKEIESELAMSEEDGEDSLEEIARSVGSIEAEEISEDIVKEQTQAVNIDEIERELASYGTEEDDKENVVNDEEVIDKSHTQAIHASIVDSLNKVEKAQGEEISPIFESTLTEAEEENVDYDAFFEEVFVESFGKYANLKGIKKQVYDCVSNIKNCEDPNTSKIGNVVIAGNKSIKKTDVAIALVRTLNLIMPEQKRKIARTSAGNLNKRGLEPVFDKLKGSALIIDEASELSEEMVIELAGIMNKETEGMLVILTDNENQILRFLSNHNKLSNMFDNLIEIRKYNVNELVDMAKDYAESKNCSINDKALLKLYLVIDKMNSQSESMDIGRIHAIIDEAIEQAKDRISKGFFSKIRKPVENGPISLKEADFLSESEE